MQAAAYCRYSTDNQTENSIAYQLDAIQKLCSAKEMNITQIYTDEAQSGTNTNREGFVRMLSDAELKKFEAVVIYDQSRLSRNVVDWFSFRDSMRKLNIKIVSCTETIEDSDNPSGFLSEGMKAVINQHFVLETRKKTIAGINNKAKQGKFCGGTPPLGYNIINGDYVINEIEADAVRMIFDLYASGHSYSFIVDKLKENGIKSKRDGIIGNNALYAILRNERYIGTFTWNKHITKYLSKWAGGKLNPNMIKIENEIPSIIDMEVWERVQERVKTNTNAKNTAKNEYLLSGIIRCGHCGGAFVGFTTTSQKGFKTRYYSCGNKRRLKNCTAKNINADDIEVLVVQLLKNDILNSDLIDNTAQAIINAAGTRKIDNKVIKDEIKDIDRKIKNLYLAVDDGLRTEGVFERIANYEIKKAALSEKLKATVNVQGEVDVDKLISKLRKDAEAVKNNTYNIRDLIKQYIVKVEITDDQVIIHGVGDLNKTGCGDRI